MSRLNFKKFDFFDIETVSENISKELGTKPSCAIAEGGTLLFGDDSGNIIMADRNFNISEKKYKVFRGEVKGIEYLYDPLNHNKQYIIAIGDDSKAKIEDESLDSVASILVIKIFSASDMSRPLHILNATSADMKARFTSFATNLDGTQIAVGYTSGAVLMFTGPFLKESSATFRAAPPYALIQSHSYSVSSLNFCELSNLKSPDRKIRLFVAFDNSPSWGTENNKESLDNDENQILNAPSDSVINPDDPSEAGLIIFDTSMNFSNGVVTMSSRLIPKVLDEKGSIPSCTAFMRSTSELVVGRNEAIYNYSIEDKGGALAIFGEKTNVCSVGRYILVATAEERSLHSAGGTLDIHPSKQINSIASSSKQKRVLITIYDMKNKIICGSSKKYHLPMNEKVLFAMSDGGIIYIVTSSWKLIRFKEKDTQRKLEVLLEQTKPPLYSLAIMVATEEQLESSEVMKLYKDYGDYLYSQNDFDGAITQYSHTIGYIPSSYVVIKFLDQYKINNLVVYLEKLYEKRLAMPDHLTLLLICYSNLKEENKIGELVNELIAKKENNGKEAQLLGSQRLFSEVKKNQNVSDSDEEDDFNTQQVISWFKKSGYLAHALKIALKYKKHFEYMDIQLNKSPPLYDDMLAYLGYVCFVSDPETFSSLFRKFGTELLEHRPEKLTKLLVLICSGNYEMLLGIKEESPESPVSPSSSSLQVLLDLRKRLSRLIDAQTPIPTGPIPLDEVLSIYSNDEKHLLELLESMFELSKGKVVDEKLSTTLVELYLRQYSHKKEIYSSLPEDDLENDTPLSKELSSSISSLESNIMNILDAPLIHYDISQMLLLVHWNGFERGERFLLEKQNSIDLLMKMLIEKNEIKEIFKVLRKEGNKDPELYVQVLTYLVSQTLKADVPLKEKKRDLDSDDDDDLVNEDGEEYSDDDDEDDEKWNNIMDIMDLIERESILSPIQILSILSTNPNLPLHVATNFIQSIFKSNSDDINKAEEDISSILLKIEALEFKRNAKLNMKVDKSNKNLSRGYEDYEDEDDEEELKLQEKRELERWTSIKKAQEDCSKDHESFYKELELSSDGFSTVANFFGRSIIP